ncbi:MAG: (d)CMP kinase [Anaerolineae bacterium]|nr:(d)CMP kinase [Anaerolineae bacterium]
MCKPSTIAIDGPAGSGKTTVGAELASRLGYVFFDTGVVYRAATLAALRAGVPVSDEQAVVRVVESMDLQVGPPDVEDGRTSTVRLDGEDVTWELRQSSVDDNVSAVSAHPQVRERLRDLQRQVASQGRVVVVGRDIGTVILPEADLKVYLDASLEERARRRHAEAVARGASISYEQALQNVCDRDRIDSGRAVAPLRRAPDAHYVDSTAIGVAEVVRLLEKLVCDRDD